jgi:hypothetical protein
MGLVGGWMIPSGEIIVKQAFKDFLSYQELVGQLLQDLLDLLGPGWSLRKQAAQLPIKRLKQEKLYLNWQSDWQLPESQNFAKNSLSSGV